MFGHVTPGTALRRNGARAGDALYVTGTVGRGVLGLYALQGRITDPDGSFAAHYRLPEPRLNLGLNEIASAAADMSDGLVQDAGHIARASGVSLVLEPHLVPLPPGAGQAGADFVTSGIAGGDDYELLLAVPPAREAALHAQAKATGVPVTRIGSFHEGPPGVTAISANGTPLAVGGQGWSHF
jgi:thiamine-monophosphate kinase